MSVKIKDPCYVSSDRKLKAKKALDILIEMAKKKEEPITYGQIGKEIGEIAINVGRILGYIRDCICDKKKSPPINLLVVNKKTRVPGINAIDGRNTILSLDEYELKKKEIYDYNKWDELLE